MDDMSEQSDTGASRTTTDHDEIRAWADEHDAVPVRGSAVPGDTELGLAANPRADDNVRIPWDRFFRRFDDEDLVFRYQPDDEGDDMPDDADAEFASGVGSRDATPDGTDITEGMALSDTGDHEPVVTEASGTDRSESATAKSARSGDESASDEPLAGDASTTDEAATTPTRDSARGPTEAADALVLESIRENRPGMDDWETNEHVSFENDGEKPLDLSGWVVRNGAGQSYRFPAGTVLRPGEPLTLHSGDGRNTETDVYWDADGPVWRSVGDTVVVETPAGDQVLDVTYKGGR